jgi:phage tail-like protein
MATADQSIAGAFAFKVTLGGVEAAGFFTSVEGLADSSEVVEHRASDAQGAPIVQKVEGQVSWNNITLKRGVDAKNELSQWRQQVLKEGAEAARKDGTIELLDAKMSPVATFKFVRGWPCRYSSTGIDASGNEVMVEEIEIVHEGFERV